MNFEHSIKQSLPFSTVPVKSWSELEKWYSETINPDKPGVRINWVFRGQGKAIWGLRTTFQRNIVDRYGPDSADIAAIEATMIREFQRHAPIYIGRHLMPELDDHLEWMSLMQHYGAPTRLLDFTYSFYAAVYFAVSQLEMSSTSPDGEMAIWVMNMGWLDTLTRSHWPSTLQALLVQDQGRRTPAFINHQFYKLDEPLAAFFTPYFLNVRINSQKGTFLSSSKVEHTLEENLKHSIFKSAETEEAARIATANAQQNFFKIVFQYNPLEIKRIVNALDRMNLNAESVYHGFEGLSKAVAEKVARENFFKLVERWRPPS